MLINLAATAEVFHTPTGIAYADLTIDGHRETWPVHGPRVRAWLRYYEATRNVPSALALNATVNLLEAQAQFDGPERIVHVRVAEHDGHIYLDLADTTWRAVEIGARWLKRRLCASAGPAVFCRCRSQSKGDQSKRWPPCSICPTKMTLCSWCPGCWPRCDRAVLIRCWRFPASRARPRPAFQSCSRP